MKEELPNSALAGSSAPAQKIQIPEILKEINKDIRKVKKYIRNIALNYIK